MKKYSKKAILADPRNVEDAGVIRIGAVKAPVVYYVSSDVMDVGGCDQEDMAVLSTYKTAPKADLMRRRRRELQSRGLRAVTVYVEPEQVPAVKALDKRGD